jgi:hypothetical protein
MLSTVTLLLFRGQINLGESGRLQIKSGRLQIKSGRHLCLLAAFAAAISATSLNAFF